MWESDITQQLIPPIIHLHLEDQEGKAAAVAQGRHI